MNRKAVKNLRVTSGKLSIHRSTEQSINHEYVSLILQIRRAAGAVAVNDKQIRDRHSYYTISEQWCVSDAPFSIFARAR
jgi:hypothetical protein